MSAGEEDVLTSTPLEKEGTFDVSFEIRQSGVNDVPLASR
jgi:hypothetical protein